MLLTLLCYGMRFLLLCPHPSPALAAENLFLRKQLALYQDRHVKPRRAANTTRLGLIWLAQWFDWRQALGDVLICPWARGFPSRPHPCRLDCMTTGIGFQRLYG
jgi:hypothetical protein